MGAAAPAADAPLLLPPLLPLPLPLLSGGIPLWFRPSVHLEPVCTAGLKPAHCIPAAHSPASL